MMIPLNKLKVGQKSKVVSLECSGAVRRHIIDMGITPGAVVIMRKAAPTVIRLKSMSEGMN